MKRNYLFAVLIFIATIGFSQTQRLVLAEEFTQASCGPCALYNPDFQSLMTANPDKVTFITYHTSWPGYDPMWEHNPDEVGTRVSYYGITGVPNVRTDGVGINGGSVPSLTQTVLDDVSSIPSPFEIKINHHLSATEDTIFVTMLIKSLESVSGDLKAHIAVIEKNIHFSSPPGSNGEKDFENVMKKMLPGDNGTSLPNMESGEYLIIEDYWVLANVYDISELGVIGFIQDNDDKAVHQAANSSTESIDLPYSNDIEPIALSNMTASNCSEQIEPIITLRNNGTSTLTSCDIIYSVNDGNMNTYNWTGNLESLESAQVLLPEYLFNTFDSNELTVTIENPNGSVDEYPSNNDISYIFSSALIATDKVMIFMRTDNDPEETSWEVTDMNGDVVESGGPYATANTVIMDTIYLAESGCYEFTLYDAGGNGLNNGSGNFVLYHGSSTTILSAKVFGSETSDQFSIDNGVGIYEPALNEDITLYPNPSNGNLTLSISSSNSNTALISIFSSIGTFVFENNINLSEGENQINLNNSGLSEGIYIVNVRVGNNIYSERLSIIK